MEQQQFRVKFPLGTKLVLSLSLLFIAVVGFLSTNAVMLVMEDKKAYTYQLQSMEAYVSGRDFSEKIRLSLDNLRFFMTAFDPRQPITTVQAENLRALVANQQEASGIASYLVLPSGDAKYLTGYENPELATKSGFALRGMIPDRAVFLDLLPKLKENTFALTVYSSPTTPTMLLVAFADLSLKDYPAGMPVALSWVDYGQLAMNRRFGDVRIANADGSILFSSDPKEIQGRKNMRSEALFQTATSSKLQTGTKEFQIGEEKYLGAFQKTAFGPIVTTQMPWRKAMAAAYTLGERFVLLGLASLGIAILFAIVFSNTITRPLKALWRATAQVSQGNFNVDPKVNTRDEVGQLSNSFVSMSRKIQELLVETVKKAHLQEELKVAAAVQESLIPPPEYRDDCIEILGHYQSANECGGDWWGFFRLGDKICIMIADATGHGIPSALITASARSCFSVIHKLAKEKAFFRLKPGEMMSYANKVVFDAATTKIMMTFFIGVIDLETKTISYANAGHNPPWLFRRNGERFQLKSLVSKGNRLGETEESGEYEEMTLPMDQGDILFLYTDGLLENKNPAGEMYGKKRTRLVVEESLPGGPRAIIEKLVESYRSYNETKPLDDDVTLAVMRILENP